MYAVSPLFREFLELLDAKKEGKPLAYWQDDIKFLDIFIGEGDCREYMLGGIICPYTDILLKLHPRKGEDSFVGFQIWGNVQGFLKHRYKEILGDGYAKFVLRHNHKRHMYHASELLDMWLEKYPARKPGEIARIREALKQQNPSVHIPLRPDVS